jgi:hypothetical protein
VSVFERLAGADPAEVRDELVALKEPERRKRAKDAEREFERIFRAPGERASSRWRAAAVAWAGTVTARKFVSEFWRLGLDLFRDGRLADDVYAVLAARGRSHFATIARGLLRSDAMWGWPLVRRGVREGLIEPPQGEEYIRGLVFGVALPWGQTPDPAATYDGLVGDPRLLEREVWQLFEIDVGGEVASLSDRWLYALTRLASEGHLDRGRLLDASLDALMRDFRASTVGWYAKLHEALGPSREERVARLDRYLALVASSAPAVVKAGLAALRELEDALDPEAFARVAPAAFAHRQKNLAVETLTLLGRLCKRHPEARAKLLDAAVQALAHERADVHERALKLLEQYPDDAPRAALLAYAEAVAPTLRPRLDQLTGFAAVPQRAAAVVLPEPRLPEPAPGEALEPVRDVEELIELAAALLAGHGSGDDVERFLDGVSRLCDERPRGFVERTQGLVDQAGPHAAWRAGLSSGGDVVATVVRAWTRGLRPGATSPRVTLGGILAGRGLEVAQRAARSRPRTLHAFPTHAGGWLDADVLAARSEAPRGFFRRSTVGHYERLATRLRTVAAARVDLRPVVVKKPRAPLRVRFVHGAVPRELASDELTRSLERLGSFDAWWRADEDWLADDALGARWALTLVPALPEIQYARALGAIVDRIDATMYRNPEVVFEHALDPRVPLRDPAWDMVAAALLAKAPDVQRLAVDLLVGAVEDERYDAQKLGTALARSLDAGLGAINRLTAPLRDVGRVSPLHGAQVVRAIEFALARLETVPRGLHALLEVAVEQSAATGRRIEHVRARATLERISGDVSRASKLGRFARSLLGD